MENNCVTCTKQTEDVSVKNVIREGHTPWDNQFTTEYDDKNLNTAPDK